MEYIGSIFTSINNDIDGLINNFGIMNRSFAELANAFISGSTSNGKNSLVNGVGAILNSLSKNLTQHDVDCLTSYNQQIDECVTSQTAWYRTMQTASEEAQNLVIAANGGKVAMDGLTTSANASRVALIAAKAATVALNMVIALGLSLAIQGIIKLIDNYIHAADNAREALENLKQEYSQNESELSSLNSELETTQNRISELERKGKLSFTEQEELDSLKKQNNELQRSIDLLETQQKLKNTEINKAFIKAVDKMEISSPNQAVNGKSEFDMLAVKLNEYKGNLNKLSETEELYFRGRKELIEANGDNADEALAQWDDWYEKEKNKLEKENSNILSILSEHNENLTEIIQDISYIPNPTTEDERKVNEYLDMIYDFQDRLAIAINSSNAKENAFNRLIDNKFSDVTKDLKELGEQGRVTAQDLNDDKYDDFIQNLIEIGFVSDDSAESLERIALAFNGSFDDMNVEGAAASIQNSSSVIISAFQSATDAVDDFKSALDSTKSGTEAFEGYAEAYKTAMDLINDGYDLDNGKLFAAAEFLLGKDALEEYGYDVAKVKKALKDLNVVFGDSETMGEGLQKALKKVVDKNGELKNSAGEVIATYKGGKWFVDNNHLDEVADALGMTEGGLVSCIQAMSTWSDVTLESLDEVIERAKEAGAVYGEQFEGKDVVNVATVRTQLQSTGQYNDKQIYDLIEQLKGNENIITIDIKADSNADDIIGQLSKIDLVSGDKDNGFTGSLENIVEKLKATGTSATDTFSIIKTLFNSNNFNFSDVIEDDLDEDGLREKVEAWFNYLDEKTGENYKVMMFVDTDEGSVQQAVYNLDKIQEQGLEIDENAITISTDDSQIDQTLSNLERLGLATQDGKTIVVDVKGVQDVMEKLGFTKQESNTLLTKLQNINNVRLDGDLITAGAIVALENTSGKVQELRDQFQILDSATLDALNSTIDGSNGKVSNLNSSLQKAIDKVNSLNGKNVTVNVSYKETNSPSASGGSSGKAKAEGTAKVDGTAFAKGNWGTSTHGTALGGEDGQEMVVRDGRYFTIGDDSAEFFEYKKGDIIFNAEQTKQLLENGKIYHGLRRGESFASGSVSSRKKSNSTSTPSKSTTGSKSSSSKSSSKSSKSSSKSSSSSNDSKVIDWIEIAINRIESAIDRLGNIASNSFETLATRLNATNSEISQVRKEISLQQSAYDKYIGQANSVGLSSSLAAKVRDGTIEIAEYSGDTAEKIEEYQKWYEKALKCSDAIQDLNKNLGELYESKFNNISKDYENQLTELEHVTNTYNKKIEEIEERGYFVTENYYTKLQNIEKQNIEIQKKELASLQKTLKEAVDTGVIKESSEAWYDLKKSINAVEEAIQDSETAVVKFANAIRDIEWSRFDYLQEQISAVTEESDFLIQLMEYSDSYTSNGQLTDTGSAIMGLHGQNYNVYMAQADKYASAVKQLTAEIANDPNNTKLLERRSELIKLQRESILAAQDEKQAIADMVEDGIKLELDSLKDLIDKYTDALDAEKDLHDYQKKVKNQTSDIAKLQKQLSAYAGDTSEEAKAIRQRLQVELSDAQDELEDTQYDHYISEQKNLLNSLYDEYEATLNQRLDNVDALVSDMIDYSNENASLISDTIAAEAENVGYDISENMQEIWSSENGAYSVMTLYGESFATSLTSINDVLNQILANVISITGGSAGIVDVKSTGTATSSITQYASGGLVSYTGLAKLDGSPSKPEMVLNPRDTANFIALKDAMQSVANGDSLLSALFGSNNISDEMIQHLTKVGNIPSSPSAQTSNITYEVNIPIERVLDYNDFVNQLVRDNQFEKFMKAVTTDQLAGGSKIAKTKYRW